MSVLLQSPVAAALLAAFVAVSLRALHGRPQWLSRFMLRPHGLVQQRRWHTLLTSGFIHADLAHLLFNAFSFWSFGFGLEPALGSGAFAALYLLGLLVSSGATWAMHRHQPQYASLGASGAILAVVFASIVVHPGASLFILPIPVPIPAPLFALAYLAYSLWAGQRGVGRVNHGAHIAGALFGVLFMAVAYDGAVGRALGVWRAQLAAVLS